MRIRLNPVVVDTQWTLQVLSRYFDTMDVQLQDVAQMDNAILESKLKLAPQMEEEERQNLIQSHYEYYEKHFPSMLRYSFILLLWSTVEAQLKATCERVGKQLRRKLTLADIRADCALSQCCKYFEKVIGVSIPDNTLWEEAQTLQKLRNAIVHANGVLKDIRRKGDRKHLQQYFKRDLGLFQDDWGAVAVKPAYCTHVLGVCGRLFHDIFDACNWEPDKQGHIIQ